MCDKCIDLDKKIEHYRKMVPLITDKMTLDGIAELIAELFAKKAELHPDQKSKAASVGGLYRRQDGVSAMPAADPALARYQIPKLPRESFFAHTALVDASRNGCELRIIR